MTRIRQNRWGVGGLVLGAILACSAAQGAQTLQFRLHDVMGREVRSEDYRGRPLFLEFGACW